MPWGLVLKAGPWLALALAGVVIWGLWGQLGTAKLKLANAEAIIAVREDDARRSAEAVAKLADTITKTEAKVITVTEKIYAAPITRDCAQSPAMRAADDGMHQLFGSGGQANTGRQPSPAVR